MMKSVKTWLSSKAPDFFDKGKKYECLNSGGDYV
jgi:hypothetical protein